MSLIVKLRKARQLPLRVLASKISRKAKAQIYNQYLRLNSHRRDVFWKLPSRWQESAQGENVLFPFWPREQKSELRDLIDKNFKEHRDAIVAAADEILKGEYRILEAQKRNLKEVSLELAQKFHCEATYLPWHFDWIHPFRWDPKKTYLDTPCWDFDGIDAKFSWELSRMHHFVTLAQAAVLSGEKVYLEEIAVQMESWMKHNPPGFGVNWACTMDVGIRAANVCFALGLAREEFAKNPDLNQRVKTLMPSFVFHHGRHIRKNLEATGNHLLGDLVGLVFLAETYPYFKDCKRWGDFSKEEMIRQMEIQVYADGMNFEASTSYHRLVTEFFFYTFLIWSKARRTLPSVFVERLKLMLKVIKVYSNTRGEAVQFGDNDSGRFLILDPGRRSLEHSYLCFLGALVFDDPSFVLDQNFAPEAMWLLGPKNYSSNFSCAKDRFLYQELPRGGIYTIRDNEKQHFLAISLSPNGQMGNGGHSHNDRLGFHLTLYGDDIFVDPGTGVYLRDRALRDALRSTLAHNTASLNGQEQNRMDVGPFALRHDVKNPKKISSQLERYDGLFSFTGEHDGYARLNPSILHRRKFDFGMKNKIVLQITDELVSEGRELVEVLWNFTLASTVAVEKPENNEVVLISPAGKKYIFQSPFGIEIVDGVYSPEFGVVVSTHSLFVKHQTSPPSFAEFLIKEI